MGITRKIVDNGYDAGVCGQKRGLSRRSVLHQAVWRKINMLTLTHTLNANSNACVDAQVRAI
jgi:hypothetical protein